MSSEFNFFQHWYPVSPVEDLQSNCPTSFTLLGLRLVIWKGKNNSTYQVFLDECPHRLAPLSEGRIDENTGNLMCSYHGWEFNGEGICQNIPQAENQNIVSKNKDNFCVKVFPAREANDLLWVWADYDSPELAQKTPLPLSPQIDAEKGFVWSSYVRDLEYDWQTFIENVADPSHVPFAHHKVQGNRKQAQPLPLEITESSQNIIQAQMKRAFNTTITFAPPCLLEYSIGFGDQGQQLGLITYCIPIMPGKCRVVAQFSRNFAKTLHHLIPKWWQHITIRNLVLDGDMVLLHQQEKFLQQKLPAKNWQTAYKLPTSADRMVIEFRKWFDTYCQGKLPWEKVGISHEDFTTIIDNHQQILNRYEQHTKHCNSCRNTLNFIEKLQTILLVFFIISVSITSILPDTLRIKLGVPLMAIALLGLGLYGYLQIWLKPKFYFVDYIHQQKI